MEQTNINIVPAMPWYKYGHVWLIIAGPALVVVAGVITVYLALSRPDPVVDAHYYQHGLEINQTLAQQQAMEPAVKARNLNTPAPTQTP